MGDVDALHVAGLGNSIAGGISFWEPVGGGITITSTHLESMLPDTDWYWDQRASSCLLNL